MNSERKVCACFDCDKEAAPGKMYCSNRCKSRASYYRHRKRFQPRRCKRPECRKEFIPRYHHQVFCSRECCDEFHYQKRRKQYSQHKLKKYIPLAFRCRFCGKWNWTKTPHEEPKRKYCNAECRIANFTNNRTPTHRQAEYKRKQRHVKSTYGLDKSRPCTGYLGVKNPECPGYLRHGYYPHYQKNSCEKCRKYFLRHQESRDDGDYVYCGAV